MQFIDLMLGQKIDPIFIIYITGINSAKITGF